MQADSRLTLAASVSTLLYSSAANSRLEPDLAGHNVCNKFVRCLLFTVILPDPACYAPERGPAL